MNHGSPKSHQVRQWGAVIASGASPIAPCNCVGPQGGQPLCPCQMRGVIVKDGRYVRPEQDLGPAAELGRQTNG